MGPGPQLAVELEIRIINRPTTFTNRKELQNWMELELIYLYFCTVLPSFVGRTVENKIKLILTEIFPSVQKHEI